MKKHPIDDIFRTKLQGLEKQPSATAWDRLNQGKKKEERRLTAWIWYAAAGVAIALMAGYSVWINQSGEVTPQLAGHPNPVEIPQDSAKPPLTQEATVELAEVVPEKNISSKVEKMRPRISPRVVQKEKEVLSEPARLATTNAPVVLELQSEISLPEIATAKNMENTHVAFTETKVAKQENRTIVVRVEEPVVNEEKEKPSRFTRIFRQLKNAKQGETVDWEDVGFNPKALVARVDDRLKTGEEKVSEKYQNIKERTKL